MQATFTDVVKGTIERFSMIKPGEHLLVGLSGGPDSSSLLLSLHHLRNDLGLTLSAAYIDHGFRPAETPAEIDFCRQLCAGLGVPFYQRAITPQALIDETGMNRHEAARELRYQALAEIAVGIKAAKIAVGHNADDQAETVIMRLVRGSGPSGLAGIPPVRDAVIRPLIETDRKSIEAFLKAEGVTAMTDSSNLLEKYSRSRIRYHVMPHLKALNPSFLDAVRRTTAIFRDEERHLEFEVTKTLMKLISRKSGTSIELFINPLETLHTAILRRLLRRALDSVKGLRALALEHIEAIIGLVKKGRSGDRIHLPGGVRAVKGYATLVITADPPVRLSEMPVTCPGDTILSDAGLLLRCSVVSRREVDDLGNGKTAACFDADSMTGPLIVRGRKTGDSFIPMGLGKHKKLQDYFVDAKVPRDERDAIPLLCSGDDIAWIVGHRVDDRFKVHDTSLRVVKIEARHLNV